MLGTARADPDNRPSGRSASLGNRPAAEELIIAERDHLALEGAVRSKFKQPGALSPVVFRPDSAHCGAGVWSGVWQKQRTGPFSAVPSG